MSVAFKQIKVYSKLTVFLIVAVAIAAVLVKNREHQVTVWFFGLTDTDRPVNVVWLMLWTGLAAVLSWWVFKTTLTLIRDTRELRRERAIRDREQQQKATAQKLREQEQRIDKKLSEAIGKEDETKD
ncbi:MAG: hypothetical protein ACE5GE_09070 [Phycisphaerae bacterium]